jgi:uncharacterized OsmC-like protein
MTRFGVTTRWAGATKTETSVTGWELGGQAYARDFVIKIDEPEQLLGDNTQANPQEFLFAAMNACMAATFVAACSVNGIALESLEIETRGELDLRGFLAIDASVKPGYDEIEAIFRVKGDASPKQFQDILNHVRKTSPNYFNLNSPVAVQSRVEVE